MLWQLLYAMPTVRGLVRCLDERIWMIESVRGIVEGCSVDAVVLRLGSVSVRLGIPGETVRALKPGQAAELFTHLHMRDDVLALYGFGTQEERSLFEELLGVSGVGPQSALGFLSLFSPTALREAIANEDITRLIKVPGVGRKTAQRVVLELKGKLDHAVGPAPVAALSRQQEDLLHVLTDSLGYSAAEATEALRSDEVATAHTDEDRLRAAIRYFAVR